MTPDPYARMELLRLSPNNGKVLTRLNLMPGQTLHGRVYKMSPYSGTTGTGPDTGGIAKIALGSHLIEAVVSKSLPEGAHVTLEVVKLSDDSFILRLIAVEESQQGKGMIEGALIEPDLIELSPQALEKLNGMAQRIITGEERADASRLVETPDWSALPKPLANSLRAAISNGFIEPAGFTANVAAMRVVLHQAVEDLYAAVTSSSTSAPAGTGELARAIDSLIAMLRPMIASLPSAETSIDDSVAQIAQALRTSATALRPILSLASATRAGGDIATQPGVGVRTPSTSSSETSSSPAQTATGTPTQQAPATGSGPAGTTLPGASPTPVAAPGTPIAPGMPTAQPPAPSPTDPAGIPPPSDQPVQKDAGSPDTAQRILTGVDQETQSGGSQPARHLLFGMRTLATLSGQLALVKGWSVEQSAQLSHHANRINTLADAIEGAIIAPLLARSIDIPDLIPRVLLSLLFPGGYADLGILQPERSGDDTPGSDEDRATDAGDHKTVGVMRLKTEALGQLRIRLDYRESDDANRVSGQFVAEPLAADEIRDSISALDQALDARGLVSDGFRIVSLNPGDDPNPLPRNRAGGLDLKV